MTPRSAARPPAPPGARRLQPAATTMALALALAAGHAAASGDYPRDGYVSRQAPDFAPGRYQAGELGVVLNSYDRLYLYAAWRSVMLGAALKTAPNPPDGLKHALGSRTGGWLDVDNSGEVYGAWRAAIDAALRRASATSSATSSANASTTSLATPAAMAALADDARSAPAQGYINCPVASYAFATSTLKELSARDDATPARLVAWITTQRQVFKFCGDDTAKPRGGYDQKKAPVAMPAELPADEARHWRQMRQYQLASAAFYQEDYAASARQFAQIGATAGHPLRQWGEYLSLRSQARAATQLPGDDSLQARWKEMAAIRREDATAAARLATQRQKLAAIEAAIGHIVAQPELAALHEASRAIGRSMQARLTPGPRFAQLSALLDTPLANPYVDDQLGDWRVLAETQLAPPPSDRSPALPDPRVAMRQAGGFIDWIQTVRQCRDYQAQSSCATERAHAVEQWQRHSRAGAQRQARVWLLAYALLSETMTPELEQASLQVAPADPEYLTVRLALARHYRLSRRLDAARAAGDAMLASPALAAGASVSARNLFLQERFAVAATPTDAANFLLRAANPAADPDTGEQAAAPGEDRKSVAADGMRWLDSGLATADLAALAEHPALDAATRTRIRVTALMRYELLGDGDAARQTARQLESQLPALAATLRQYRQAAPAERRHRLLLAGLTFGISPMYGDNQWRYAPVQAREPADAVADMWCKMPATAGAAYRENTGAEYSLPMPDTGNGAARDAELARLAALKTATGMVGDHVLRRAAATPADPDLPWLLYVTVQSTRGGCLDADAGALSKSAFSLLHKRYRDSAWARRTPYHY